MARRCIHSTRHNHVYVRFATGSLSISTSTALMRVLVFHVLSSGLCEQYSPGSSPFIYYTLSDWGQRGESAMTSVHYCLEGSQKDILNP